MVGTPTAGDVLNITVYDPALSGGQETVSYTVQSGDTLADIAYGLSGAVNGNTNLSGIGVYSWYVGETAQIQSFSANVSTFTQSASTGATESVVFSLNQNMSRNGAIAGTATAGDVLTVAVYDAALPGGTQTASYTVQSGDGLNDIATGLANALNANTDIYSIVVSYTDGGSNLIMNSTSVNPTTYRATTSSGATATIVLSTGAAQTGAAFGSTQCQYNNVNELVSIGSGGVTQYQATTNKAVKSGSVATNGFALQQAANLITYSLPEYSSATTTIALANVLNGNVDATLSGSVTTGNVLSIIVHNASLTNGQEQVNYTVQSGDTLTTIAAGISTAINANTNLTALGISSTSSSATVSIAQPTTTYSSSNSSGATEFIGLGNNNNGNAVAEIGGSATPGDTVTLTVNNPVLSGGTESVTYTVQSGDDNILIAEGVAALVNGNTPLSNLGITAQSDVPAVLDWSQSFKATQQTPGWNATSVSAVDGGNNSASAPYSVFGIAPTPVNPTYDRNGNMTSDGTNSYLWDAENRLVDIDYPGSGNNSQFTYDGLGHNVKIVENSGGSPTSTKQFVWCSDDRCEARDASSSPIAQYFYRGTKIGSSGYVYTRDQLGSVREVLGTAGSTEAQYAYDPFGRKSILAETTPSDFGFAGMYLHVQSGLSLTKFRAYNAMVGRWISRDPISERAGVNLYAYVLNDPVDFKDAYGLRGIFQGAKQGFTGGAHWHGNWGGGKWANGRFGPDTTTHNFPHQPGDEGYNPPVDPEDYCYYLHDLCLHNAAIDFDKETRTCNRKKCDKGLADCLDSTGIMSPEPRFWRGNPNSGPGPWAPENDYYTPAPPDPNWYWEPPYDFQPHPPAF